MVQSLKKNAGMLVSATMGFPKERISKVGVYSDATAAVLGCSNLYVPDQKLYYLTAKSRKVAHWRDDNAFTLSIPIWFAGIPGHKHNFSDWLSHCFEEMVARAEKGKKAKTVSTCVMALVDVVMAAPARELDRDSFAKGLEVEQVPAGGSDSSVRVPAGSEAAKLLSSDDEWAEVCSKYLNSKSELRSVLLSEVYRVLALDDVPVSKLVGNKIIGWKLRIKVMEVGDGEIALFVKAPAMGISLEDWTDIEEGEQEGKLVLLLPEGAMVRVSPAELIEEEKDPDSYRYTDMRNVLLVLVHEFQLHAKVGLMYLFVAKRRRECDGLS